MWYITIRADSRSSEFSQSASLVDFVDRVQSELTRPILDWRRVVFLGIKTELENGSLTNYMDYSNLEKKFNVVDFIFMSNQPHYQEHSALACRIAEFLGWEAFNPDVPETDEDYWIWRKT